MTLTIRAALEQVVFAYAECRDQYEEFWPDVLDEPMANARAALKARPEGEGPSDDDVDELCATNGAALEAVSKSKMTPSINHH